MGNGFLMRFYSKNTIEISLVNQPRMPVAINNLFC